MKYKLVLFILCILLSFGFSQKKTSANNDRLISAVTCDALKKFFGICKQNKDTITLYTNLDKFGNCPVFKVDCNKTIVFEKSSIKIDVSKSVTTSEEKIVLYDFKKIKNTYQFRFINIRTNGNLILTLNRHNELVNVEKGFF